MNICSDTGQLEQLWLILYICGIHHLTFIQLANVPTKLKSPLQAKAQNKH